MSRLLRDRGCTDLPKPQVYYSDPGQRSLQTDSFLCLTAGSTNKSATCGRIFYKVDHYQQKVKRNYQFTSCRVPVSVLLPPLLSTDGYIWISVDARDLYSRLWLPDKLATASWLSSSVGLLLCRSQSLRVNQQDLQLVLSQGGLYRSFGVSKVISAVVSGPFYSPVVFQEERDLIHVQACSFI